MPDGWVIAWLASGLLGMLLVPLAADEWATPSRTAAVLGADARPRLDAALAQWLQTLCNGTGAHECQPAVPLDDGRLVVYFVSTEGGGIRAAVWTAFALHQLMLQDADLLTRTFSISGVSGGALGAAAFRACSAEPEERAECLKQFAKTDYLSALLGAWTFEDVIGTVLPTSWCRTPGCGFLSRGAWFEQALEAGAPGLRLGLIESGQRLRRSAPHIPYLLLNATWVETGERAIASDLVIDWRQFAGAKDQLGIVGRDLPLSTAAHNAARFPFINPVGSVHAPARLCAASAPAPGILHENCGHVVDGGYFENGGAQSTIDVLTTLAACLGATQEPPAACRDRLSVEQLDWLRAHLTPQVLMIRNGMESEPVGDRSETPPVTANGAPQVAGSPQQPSRDDYVPERPVDRADDGLFVAVLAPVRALVGSGGTGGNGRLAQARQREAVVALRFSLRRQVATSDRPGVKTLDLLREDTLFPLGWHLSPAAIEGIWAQSRALRP